MRGVSAHPASSQKKRGHFEKTSHRPTPARPASDHVRVCVLLCVETLQFEWSCKSASWWLAREANAQCSSVGGGRVPAPRQGKRVADFGLCHQLALRHAIRTFERLGLVLLRLSVAPFPAGVRCVRDKHSSSESSRLLTGCLGVRCAGSRQCPNRLDRQDLTVAERRKCPTHQVTARSLHQRHPCPNWTHCFWSSRRGCESGYNLESVCVSTP